MVPELAAPTMTAVAPSTDSAPVIVMVYVSPSVSVAATISADSTSSANAALTIALAISDFVSTHEVAGLALVW